MISHITRGSIQVGSTHGYPCLLDDFVLDEQLRTKRKKNKLKRQKIVKKDINIFSFMLRMRRQRHREKKFAVFTEMLVTIVKHQH